MYSLFSLVGLAAVALAAPSRLSDGPQVHTPLGTYIGATSKNGHIESFRGIDYGLPPVGDLRFAPPQPVTKNFGVFDATVSDAALLFALLIRSSSHQIVNQERYTDEQVHPSQVNGYACPQMNIVAGALNLPPAIGSLLDSAFETIIQNPALSPIASANASEDCLNLKIARPAGTNDQSKLPVMIWVGFSQSSFFSFPVLLFQLLISIASLSPPLNHLQFIRCSLAPFYGGLERVPTRAIPLSIDR